MSLLNNYETFFQKQTEDHTFLVSLCCSLLLQESLSMVLNALTSVELQQKAVVAHT